MRADQIACWRCGEALAADTPLPLSRWARCRHCHTDLHSCMQCRFYDPARSNSCREPMAERVSDKKRSNVCDYFQPEPEAHRRGDTSRADAARDQLESLFDLPGNSGGTDNGQQSSAEEDARARLDELFGLDKDGKD